MSFEFIKKFPNHIYVPKIVPLVYDDTLSYYEFLCKVLNKMNEAIESLNALGVRVDDLEAAVEQLQEIVNSFDDRLTAVEGDVRDIKSDIRDINTAIGNINTAIEGINTQIGDLVINVRNNSNSITQINSAISDIRDSISELSEIPGDIEDLEQDVGGLKTRVTSLESATFGDITVEPQPYNFCCNMQDITKVPYEISIDYDVRDPERDDTVEIDDDQFRFRGNSGYNRTHLILKNFVQELGDGCAVSLLIVYFQVYNWEYTQALNTTFGALKSGVSLIVDNEDNVGVGGAKLIASGNNDNLYDLHLYVDAQNGSGDMIENTSYYLRWIALVKGTGYVPDGRSLAPDGFRRYMNAYNSGMPETGVSQDDFDTLSGRVTTAEGEIDDLQTAIGTFTQTEYNSDWNIMNNYVHGIDDRVTAVEGDISSEEVETWVSFDDVFENGVFPQDAIIHHFRMDKKGRLITFELGMINLNDDSTYRYNSYTLGTIRSGLRAKLAPAMDTPVMFIGMLGGTDNNIDKGYLVSGSIPATPQNPPMPQVTGVAIASLYGAIGTNYYTNIGTYGDLPPYSLIVKLEPWSVTSQGYRNSFIIRGTYLSE